MCIRCVYNKSPYDTNIYSIIYSTIYYNILHHNILYYNYIYVYIDVCPRERHLAAAGGIYY